MRLLTMIPIALSAALLAACAATQPEPVTVQNDAETRAVIQSVDATTREILLRTEDGRLVSLVAGPAVRNFDQLEAGDTVLAAFAESVTVAMAAPGQAVVTRGGAAEARAEPGERPGAAAGVAIDAVVEWVSYDPETTLSTFIGASGFTHSLPTPPEMRALAAGFEAGDSVQIQYSSAVAIEVEEIGG